MLPTCDSGLSDEGLPTFWAAVFFIMASSDFSRSGADTDCPPPPAPVPPPAVPPPAVPPPPDCGTPPGPDPPGAPVGAAPAD
ncbi:hypothetical protein EF294_16860 [Gordonia oryzae]|uniref:Uncharacterized protein n=1 Tax=Gordonia oryzae TaxID=2487349 RepID=A0A3N4G7K7_9ACTN|nr:hypothetical protein EF294_16860 [Gordonia oryzae]